MSTGAKAPRVSVVTAAYNAERFLAATLRTVRDQTFGDFEHLVIDDGSTDGTADLVRRQAAADPRWRLIEQSNRGLAATRNRGVGEARGELVAFLDHDDLWHPQKLEQQVAALDGRPEAAVAVCHSAVVDEDGRCLGWRLGSDADGDVYDEMLEWDMVSGGSVALVRRAALTAIGPFDETLPARSDYEAWIRLARRYPFVSVARPLVGYRRGSSSSSRAYERLAEAGDRLLELAVRNDPAIDDRRHRFLRARDRFGIACLALIDREPRTAWRFVGRSWALSPRPLLAQPRRWAVLGALTLATALPRRLDRALFSLLSRRAFGIRPGRPFEELGRNGS